MDLKTAMMERIFSMKDPAVWHKSLDMSWESMREIAQKYDLTKIDHVYLVGCGTSMANAHIGEAFFEGIALQQAEAQHGFSFSEYMRPEMLGPTKMVVGITGMGVTTSVCRSLETAARGGAFTVCVTGKADSPCGKAADAVMMTDALNEGPTVRTISNIFLQLGLYVLALGFGMAKGRVNEAKKDYWNGQLDALIKGVPAALERKGEIDALAKKYHDLQGEMVIFLGPGPNYGTAFEASLMSVEMGWVDSAGYEMEEFIHGRFREMDVTKPMIFLAPHGPSYGKLLTILTSCRRGNVPTLVITNEAPQALQELADDILLMPGGIDEVLTPLLYVFPSWLFDYETGILRGVDPAGQRYGITAVEINQATL